MKVKGYKKYKASGVEWLGEIPDTWEVWKFAHLTTRIGSGKTPTGGANVYQSDGVIFIRSQNVYDDGLRLDDVVYIDESIDEDMAWSRVQENDILLNITGASLGRTCIMPTGLGNANVNQHVCVIRLRNVQNAQYISHYLTSRQAKSFYDYVQTGSAREGLNFQQIGAFSVLLPPLPEQKLIASYLDRETGRIDSLIDKKQRIVELLKEKRTALISRAVTKGLPSTGSGQATQKVKMKASGVEWLGEVPEHWIVKKLKWAYQNIGSGDGISPEDIEPSGTYPVYGGNGVMGFAERFNSSDDDIIIGRVGAKCGNVYIVSGEKWISDNALKLEIGNCCKNYIKLLLEMRGLNQLANKNAQPLITGGMVGNQFVPFPPLSEQKSIASYLDHQTSRLDALIFKVNTAIDTLKEYRTALISAAVTGKIDVREAT